MTWRDVREAGLRVKGLWQRRRQEQELEDELAHHKAMKERNYCERLGLNAQEASERVKREFGGFERWKEAWRDVARWRVLEELGKDLALAIRMLRKSPGFTCVALAMLTLAIGANTAIFGLIDTLMVKDLGVPNGKRLMILRTELDKEPMYAFSYPVYKGLAANSNAPFETFAFTDQTLQVRHGAAIEQASGQLVSGKYFAALGTKPAMGRWILADDDRPGAPGGMVAVVSSRFWRNALNGNPQVLGSKLTINQGAFRIVGVMPDGFRGMSRDTQTDIYVPFELEPFIDAPFNNIAGGIHSWWFGAGGILHEGVSLEQANAYLRTTSQRVLKDAVPAGMNFTLNGFDIKKSYVRAEAGSNGLSYLRMRFRKPLTVLMALVSMVLLIACLNLATLMTARAASREREISTRFALGASRARLLRQFLTESLLLASGGTLLGLAISPILARSLGAMLASQRDPYAVPIEMAPDATVFLFTALVVVLTTLITGTLPAMRSTGGGFEAPLREASNRLRGGERRHWGPRMLLSIEVALSLVLVTGGCLLGYSLVKLHEIPAGFEARGLIYMPLSTERQARKGAALTAAYQDLVSEIKKLPGVAAVSLTSVIPLTGTSMSSDATVPGEKPHEVWQASVGPEYFQAMRIPLEEGREFDWRDNDAAGRKVILNRAAAKLLFHGRRVTGSHIKLDTHKEGEVIGVVGDAKYTTMRDAAPPTVYSTVTQDVIEGSSWTLLIRANGAPAPVINAARKTVVRVIPDIPTPAAFNMQETIDESLASERMMAMLALFFGVLALLMTGIGLYGTLAYATERRTGEIGIRLALGARPGNVISMICAENGLIAAVGCAVGLGASFAASKTIESFLYGVSARDPWLFAASAILLLGIAAGASLIPAVKASKIDPLEAIRYE